MGGGVTRVNCATDCVNVHASWLFFTEQRVMSVTKEQPRPSLTAGFIIGGSDEILNTLTHELIHFLHANTNTCTRAI